MKSLFLIIITLSCTGLPYATRAGAQNCDPQETQKVSDPDGSAFAIFGWAIATHNDTMIITAKFEDAPVEDSGAAHLFQRENGVWTHVKRITPLSTDTEFGETAAISSDTVVVGRTNETRDWGDGFFRGSAFIFDRNEGGPDNWGQVKHLGPGLADRGDLFSSDLDIDGDTIIVGAPNADPVQQDLMTGAAYIFERHLGGNNNWGVRKEFVGSRQGALFGWQVAISGDTVAITSNHGDTPGVHIYERNLGGENNWGLRTVILPDGLDTFGSRIDLDGSTLVVGENFENNSTGAVYIFERDLGGQDRWGLAQRMVASDGQELDNFGFDVAIDRSVIVAGTEGPEKAYVLVKQADGSWIEEAILYASDGSGADNFGQTVTIEEHTVVVGAWIADGAVDDSGAAYDFDLNCGPTLRLIGQCPGRVGFVVEGAQANTRVAFLYARGEGSFEIPPGNPCAGTVLGLDRTVELADVVRADDRGAAVLETSVPSAACGRIFVQAIDLMTCGTTNVSLID